MESCWEGSLHTLEFRRGCGPGVASATSSNPTWSRVWSRGFAFYLLKHSLWFQLLRPSGRFLWQQELTHPPVGSHAKSFHLMAANCLALWGKLGESVSGKNDPGEYSTTAYYML